MNRKAQINIEFLAAALIYIGALGALVTAGQGILPEFTSDAQEASLNLEARQISTQILSNPGWQSYSGSTNWEKNNTTVEHASAVGLASSFKQVERDKLMRLRTADPRGSGFNYLNYSQFKEISGADNQYQFTFTWMPLIETPESFTRGQGSSQTPSITEPVTGYYSSAGNTVHYGSETLNGTDYHFLTTSHDGVYNTTYVSRNWNFRGYPPLGTGDVFGRKGDEFKIQRFQNRENDPGALVIVSQQLKTFGASVDSDSRVISMQRYAVMEDEPLRVKVLAW
ncbi:MAG: hypothetical protein ABEJ07_03465 [Candidatus Nanohaloarchaea archaeon]